MLELDVLLALYGRMLEPTPVGFICFDTSPAVVHATAPVQDLPMAALSRHASQVISTGQPVQGAVLGDLSVTCVALHANELVVGVVCVLENPRWDGDNRNAVTNAAEAVAVFDSEGTRVFANVAWNALTVRTTELIALARDPETGMFTLHGCDVLGRPFVSALGATRGTIVVCRPKGERERLAEVELASRQKDQFIAIVAHELRAPLATLLLWERVLRNETIDEMTRARALEAIHESATTQSWLVGDLLEVSRAINGKLRVDRNPVLVDDILRAVVEEHQPIAAAKQVAFVLDLAGEPEHVLGDASRLRQVFANLITNALNVSPTDGVITIARRRRGTYVDIRVTDAGRGIAPDLLPHLFEPFRQGTDTPEGGLGLGLAIAHQLVRLHHGTLSATSDGLDRGATFVVHLPRATIAPTAQRATTRTRSRLEGVRVLVVDDDPRLLEALQILLQGAGALVDTARSAEAGCGAVARSTPDVVLSDLAMPDGDGCSMMRRIRASEAGVRRVPAVAMTAHIADANRHDALAAGFDRYLTKPLDVDHLINTLAGLVRA
jgi:signal transduction histidine kinase/CheY-like chemotaxis protein